jgi:hypothetical protein
MSTSYLLPLADPQASLGLIVEETLQPESVSLWLRATRDEGRTK